MSTSRTTYTISLEPLIGSRFQPTGFPDLGAAVFQRAGQDGKAEDSILVESVQSMANHCERATWDEAAQTQVPDLEGLPYVEVVDQNGEFLTSSRLESHRLACSYIMEGVIEGGTGEEWFGKQFALAKDRPLDSRQVARVIFRLDPLSLIHGVFFARSSKAWPWQPRVARALTCFIEADGALPAISGGVKKDSVSSAGGNTDTGYGMVPYGRTEFTARNITAYVAVDHDQMRSYGLGAEGTELLEAIIDFELARLFDGGLRLRTACDLRVVEGAEGLPTIDAANKRVAEAIRQASDLLGPVTTVQWTARANSKKA